MVDIPTHVAKIFTRLGEPVAYVPQGGLAKTVNGIVRLRPSSPTIGYEVGGAKPVVDVLLTDIPNPQTGDSVTIRNVAYSVLSPEIDEVSGTALLRLRKAV